MAYHHYPYRLTLLQRRLYIILLAEAKRPDGDGRRLSAAEISRRLRPAIDASSANKALTALQFKLPLLATRPTWRVHCGPGEQRAEVWWVEERRAKDGEMGRRGEGETWREGEEERA